MTTKELEDMKDIYIELNEIDDLLQDWFTFGPNNPKGITLMETFFEVARKNYQALSIVSYHLAKGDAECEEPPH